VIGDRQSDFPPFIIPHLDIGYWFFVIGYSPHFSIAIVIAIVIGLPPLFFFTTN
jgi:hypothetical protein